jgi:site-specific recombinase XerD
MQFNFKYLEELADSAVVYLRSKGKSESTISKYVWIWNQVDRYLHANKIMECNKDAVIGYVRDKFEDRRICDLSHYEKNCVSQAFNLIQFMETGEMFEMVELVPREKVELTGAIGGLMQDYILHKKSRRLSEKTLGNYKWYLYCFQKHLYANGIVEIQRLSPMAILTYCSGMSPGHLGAKHAALYVLRSFFRFIYDAKQTKTDLSLVIPSDNYKQQPKLPSTYTKEEVKKVLATADRSTAIGKRNYAILLLIIRLGLRASDVRSLVFDHIKWAMNTVSFEQSKTGENVELPLTADVGEAVIDYLKYGRPVTGERYIFIEHIYPYGQLREKTVSGVANHAICRSGIDIGYRKHGSHALRHTMAGFLMEGQTPLPVISALLGHKSVQSTMSYLRVDIESLRQCALDVPTVDVLFYEQRNGSFYK